MTVKLVKCQDPSPLKQSFYCPAQISHRIMIKGETVEPVNSHFLLSDASEMKILCSKNGIWVAWHCWCSSIVQISSDIMHLWDWMIQAQSKWVLHVYKSWMSWMAGWLADLISRIRVGWIRQESCTHPTQIKHWTKTKVNKSLIDMCVWNSEYLGDAWYPYRMQI